jgi:hypothetical protein
MNNRLPWDITAIDAADERLAAAGLGGSSAHDTEAVSA